MLSQEGCRTRQERFCERLPTEIDWALVANPAHLAYFANFSPSPFVFNSQSASAVLILGRDGSSILVADNVQEPFLNEAFATEKLMPVWYRCIESAGPRASLVVDAALERLRACTGAAIGHEATGIPAALLDGLRSARPAVRLIDIDPVLRDLRRAKAPDEVLAVRRSLEAATIALKTAMRELRPGMTELDTYRLVQRVASEAAGQPVLLYGDFVSGSRCEQIGGPPSARVIQPGELVLLDYSVVIDGYRGDFCNTFTCGGRTDARHHALYEACVAAMRAGERQLRAGVSCRDVYRAVRSALAERGLAESFPHHAGHGIGLGHPEPPYFVPDSSETLVAGDVVTLEPGVYIPGVAGMRYERDYLITNGGYELLSDHPIEIDPSNL